MFMKQDWLMRQIEVLAVAVAQLVFGKGGVEYDLKEEDGQTRSDGVERALAELIEQDRLGEAEDLLFAGMDRVDLAGLARALDFYQTANRLSDETLGRQGFTRQELLEGLREAVERYGIDIPGLV